MSEKITRTYKYLPYSAFSKASYNRPINSARVREIMNKFDPAEVRPVIVSERNGIYHVIDGQHTALALLKLNNNDRNTMIYCDVRTGLSEEQEAALYVRLNKNSKPIGIADEIKGRIEACDPLALTFKETIEDFGYTLFNGNKVTAISTAWAIYKKADGRKHLSEILDLIYDTWGYVQNSTNALTLRGIDAFLDLHSDEYSKETFIKKLSAQNPSTLINNACEYARIANITRPQAMYMMLLNTYNKQLRVGKLKDKYSSSTNRY